MTSLTASTGENKTTDVPAMISASDIYVHILKGSVEVYITFLPGIFDFEISLIKRPVSGKDGSYACVTSAFDELVVPGDLLSTPGDPKSTTTWPSASFPSTGAQPRPAARRCARGQRAARRTLTCIRTRVWSSRGQQKTSHCTANDFDGEVMKDTEFVQAKAGAALVWKNQWSWIGFGAVDLSRQERLPK